MFTGIVEGTGKIRETIDESGGRRLRIETDLDGEFHHGQSIAVSGVCLTVETFGAERATEKGPWFEVFLAEETVERTYLGEVEVGDLLNVERAMPADGRFDGHVVQGHVDTTTEISSIERVGEDWRFGFELPDGHDRYLVEKGSIALDGISLTIASIDRVDGNFEVAIIPTTYELTNFGEKSVGDPVHVEVDVIAKYVENMLEGYDDR